MRFSLGTISATAAWATIFVLMFFGVRYAYAIPLLAYAVPCGAAFKKKPAIFWRTFTLLSVFGAACATFYCTVGGRRDINGVEVAGFPMVYPTTPDLTHFFAMLVNATLVSGVCLLPLSAWSTIDTLRKRKRELRAAPLRPR